MQRSNNLTYQSNSLKRQYNRRPRNPALTTPSAHDPMFNRVIGTTNDLPTSIFKDAMVASDPQNSMTTMHFAVNHRWPGVLQLRVGALKPDLYHQRDRGLVRHRVVPLSFRSVLKGKVTSVYRPLCWICSPRWPSSAVSSRGSALTC